MKIIMYKWLPWSGLILLFGILYGPVMRALTQVWWEDPNYSHGLLIPFIFAYLLWSRRHRLLSSLPSPSRLGLLLLAGTLGLLIMGRVAETVGAGYSGLFLSGLSLIGVLAGLTLALGGRTFLRELSLPLVYLVFMLPLPGVFFTLMTLPLQNYATAVTTAFLSLFGIPVLREGNVLFLPNMTLGVVEACSGIRSVFSLLALAAAVSLILMPSTPRWAKLLLTASAVPIAILTNTFRVTATGLLAHTWGLEMAQGFYHEFSGWIVFLAAFVILSAENLLLQRISR